MFEYFELISFQPQLLKIFVYIYCHSMSYERKKKGVFLIERSCMRDYDDDDVDVSFFMHHLISINHY